MSNAVGCIPTSMTVLPDGTPVTITPAYIKAMCDECGEVEIWVGPRGQAVHTLAGAPRLCPDCVIAFASGGERPRIVNLGGQDEGGGS